LQLEKTREQKTKEHLERMNELHLQQVKEQVQRERERSLENDKKATLDYQREQQIEEERQRLREEKERRKRENHERGILGVLEVKQRKQEIDMLMQQRHKQVKEKVTSKVMLIEEKYNTVEEERLAKALELKRDNDIKIRMAKEKEEINRRAKLMKDMDRMKTIEEQVRHYRDQRHREDYERQQRSEE
jgi:hypothetical protein